MVMAILMQAIHSLTILASGQIEMEMAEEIIQMAPTQTHSQMIHLNGKIQMEMVMEIILAV